MGTIRENSSHSIPITVVIVHAKLLLLWPDAPADQRPAVATLNLPAMLFRALLLCRPFGFPEGEPSRTKLLSGLNICSSED